MNKPIEGREGRAGLAHFFFARHRLTLAVGLACCAMAATSVAHAQVSAPTSSSSEDEAAPVLPPTVVSGQRDPQQATEGNGSYAGQGGVVGTGLGLSARETPQSITVLTRERLDDQNLHSLEEAMNQTTGITVGYAGTGIVYNFYSRGFTLDNFRFDGVSTQNGAGYYTQPDLALYDRVEVLRGAAGLLSGSGEPAGAVNLVRKRPTARRQLQGSMSLGSWSSRRGELDVSGALNAAGTLRGRAVLVQEDKGVFYDAQNNTKSVLYGVLEGDIAPGTVLRGGISYQKWRSPMMFGLPRYSNGADMALPRETYLSADWNHWSFETPQVFAELEHQFNEDWRLKLNLSRLKETSSFKYAYGNGSVNPATGAGLRLAGGAGHYENEQTSFDATLSGAFQAFGRRHDTVIGAQWSKRENLSFSSGNNYQATGWFFPQSGQAVTAEGFGVTPILEPAMPTFTPSGQTDTEQKGLFGVMRWSLADSVKLITGARLSWYDYQQRNLNTRAITSRYKQSHELTPYAGIVYDFAPQWSAYASYTDIFRVQSNYYDASGNPLDPAVGANYEAGVKGALYDGRLNLSAALFRIDESNRAQVDPSYPEPCAASPTGGACYVNEGKVRSQGFELEASGELRPGWQLSAGYTHNTTRYLRDRTATGAASSNEGQSYRSIAPKHMLKLWTRYQLPGEWQNWHLGGGVNIQSKTTVSSSTLTVVQPGYAVWGLNVGWRMGEHWSLALNVNNLFDKTYYRRISTGFGNNYGEPRSATLTLRAKF